jgi:hypothetical protein
VAPALDPTVATTVFAATEFLYTGPDSIQRGVAPGTIELRRAAAIRGKVLDRSGNPISGVRVEIHDRPEFGYTRTRTDGDWDLAINGGGSLTVQFTKQGWLTAHRTVNPAWQEWHELPEVHLVALDRTGGHADRAEQRDTGRRRIETGHTDVQARYRCRGSVC